MAMVKDAEHMGSSGGYYFATVIKGVIVQQQ
jgi:hypothetical protein